MVAPNVLRIALCEYVVYPYREALEALHLACGPSHGAKSSWWSLLGTSAPVKPAAKIDHLYDDDLGAPAPAYLCTGSTLKEAQLISSASVAQGLDTGRDLVAQPPAGLGSLSGPARQQQHQQRMLGDVAATEGERCGTG